MLKPIILGVDSGITTAYAAFEIDGSLIKVKSSRTESQADMITDIIRHGKVVLVGVDVKPSSAFGKEVASIFGARLVVPKRKISIMEKVCAARDYGSKNKHERDALAAGLFAYKRIKPLLNRIDTRLKRRNKAEYSGLVKYLMLTKKNLNIERALRTIEGRA